MVFLHLEVDEGIPAFELQARIVRALVAEGRELAFGHSRSADRSRSMCRVENDLVPKRHNLLQRVVKEASDLALAIGIEIGATDVADEQRVSSEHADWPIGIGSVVEHKSKMIVRMSGRFQHSNFELADFKLITLVRRVGIFDRFRRIGTVQDTRAG